MLVRVIKALTVPFTALLVALLVWYAMSKGIDGAVLMSGLALIGGLGGYQVKASVDARKKSEAPPTPPVA